MILKLKKWVYGWPTAAAIIVFVFFLIDAIGCFGSDIITFSIDIYFLVLIYRVRKLKKHNTKIHLEKLRKQWNETFGDNSFDNYFDAKTIKSKLFTEYFNSEFARRCMEEEMKRKFNKNNNKSYNKQNSNNEKSEKKQYNNTNELDCALNFFNYKSLNEVKLDELKARYRKMVKKFHPDNGGDIQDVQKLNIYYNKIKTCL